METYCLRRKNAQKQDFQDLKEACDKCEFPVPHMELLIDVMAGYKTLPFIDG